MASNEGDVESTQFRGNFSISPGNITEGETGFLEVHDKTYCDKFLEFTPNFGINIDGVKIKDLSLIHISEPTRPCGTSRMPSSA